MLYPERDEGQDRVRVAGNILDLVGQTPMVRIHRLGAPCSRAEILAKLEFLNPGGSIKDRAALGIILDAERRGVLQPGDTITEATAGNTGVGLALIGVQRGYNVVLFVPENFAEEKCMLMRGLGAKVIRTPAEDGVNGAIKGALHLERTQPKVFAALQFENPANPDFHEATTAPEMWEQLEGRVDALVLGVGSAGTFTGIARFFKKRLPDMLTIAVEAQGSVLQGGEPGPRRVEGIGVSFVPSTFDRTVCDRVVMISDDCAFATARALAAQEGIFAGGSAGAIMAAALEIARELGSGKRVATIVPDSAERYLSQGTFGCHQHD